MSKFNGHFYQRDVGLVDQALDVLPEPFVPENHTDNFLVFTDVNGSLENVEVLDVSIRGVGVNSEGDKFIVTNGTTVGNYVIKAKLNYKNASSDVVNEKIYTINLPIPKEQYISQLEIDLIKNMDVLRFGPLPRVAATNITPTEKESEFKFTIEAKLAAFMLSSYVNEASINENTLTFAKSFHKLDKSGSETVVQIRYNSVANKNTGNFLSISYSEAGNNQVKSIDYARVKSIAIPGTVSGTTFSLDMSNELDINCSVLATINNGTTKGLKVSSNNGIIRGKKTSSGSISGTFTVKDYVENTSFTTNLNSGFVYKLDTLTLHIGEGSGSGDVNYNFNADGTKNGFSFLQGYPIKFIKHPTKTGYWLGELDYADVENVSASGVGIFLYEPLLPVSQFKINYVPATSGNKIAAMLEAKYKEVQVEGSVAGASITVSKFNVVCSNYRYITGDNEDVSGNDDKVLVLGIVSTNNANKFSIVGDDYAFTLSFDEDKEIEVNGDDGNTFAAGSKILIPAGVKLPFKKFENGKYRLSADESLMYEKNEFVRGDLKSWNVNSDAFVDKTYRGNSYKVVAFFTGYDNKCYIFGMNEAVHAVTTSFSPSDGMTYYSVGLTSSYNSVYKNNGVYWVAVGQSGAIVYNSSAYGNWTNATKTDTISYHLYSVYCNQNYNYWVAVGYNGAIVYTTTGTGGNGWTNATKTDTISETLHSVCCNFESGYWVAVGNDGTIVYTPAGSGNNGWAYATKTNVISETLHSVCCRHGYGHWVAVGNDGAIVYTTTSTGGNGWAYAGKIDTITEYLYSVCCNLNNAHWVAVGSGGAIAYTSTSTGGGGWKKASKIGSITTILVSVCSYNSYWVAVGHNGTIAYTTDSTGASGWKLYDPGDSLFIKSSMNSLSYTDGKYVAVGNNGIVAHTSNNGSTWTLPFINSSDVEVVWNSVCYNGSNQYVAVGSKCEVAYSSNGTSWSLGSVANKNTNINWDACCYDESGKYYACGSGSYFTSSTDGINWSAPTVTLAPIEFHSIYANNTSIIMVGNSGGIAYSSNGGTSWTYNQSYTSVNWYSVCLVDENNYALVGSQAKFAYGTISNWTVTTIGSDTSITWSSIYYVNSTLIAVSQQNKVAYSYDLGLTWAIETIDSSNASSVWNAITYDTTNKRFITVGDDGKFAYHAWVPPTPTNPIIPLHFKGLNYNENIGFRALDKSTTASINPAFTVYEDKLASGTLLDHITDAGFVIPIIDSGRYLKKYVRISDLYNEVINFQPNENNSVVDLADRLHACEVALEDTCSSTLEDGESGSEADRLYNIKNKWCVVDTYGMD